MKLYTVPGNPTGRKVLAVANHLGLEMETEELSFQDGDTKSESYLAINPNGKIPTLVHENRIISESNAINIYLCTMGIPDHSLFAPELRPEIVQWLFWEASQYTAIMRTIMTESLVKPYFGLGETDTHIVEVARNEFERYAKILDKHLEGRQFIVGNDWTLADYAIGFFETTRTRLPMDFNVYPNIKAFYERFHDNPYWAATAPTPDTN